MAQSSSAMSIVQRVFSFQVEEPGRRERRQAGKREWVEIESFKMDEKNGNFPKKPGEPVGEWDPHLISLDRRSKAVVSIQSINVNIIRFSKTVYLPTLA